MHETRCDSCLQIQLVEYKGSSVSSVIPHYCSYCGFKGVTIVKVDNYWFDLAESLGFERCKESADLVKKLYDMWPISQFRHFRDYVESLAEEYSEEE